ncbi:hypothetical protein [Longirhabdus pacifica]|uniref:hypothetical protein n=1 Tax=Longirhabdus pacifica TaxID=2305227 RepID=UPI0010087ACD|nr:hypothetical protein [Longirhabdus pacifica]
MAIAEYFQAIEDVIKSQFPTKQVVKHHFSNTINGDTFYMYHVEDKREKQMQQHMIIQRQCRIEYVDVSAEQALMEMDKLSEVLHQVQGIPISTNQNQHKQANNGIAVEYFIINEVKQIPQNEDSQTTEQIGMHQCTGVLLTTERVPMQQQSWDKMNKMYVNNNLIAQAEI